ncbi:type II toxin-antitoxin system RelB family antitoxin [Microbacterium halophytorum]|uniref:type II toxin-antitoxin system RelB family antitoxin n=1 Tax=Microbacterium halophytorum TaxID=2067568 RepID=UPI0018E09224|nr:TraY domain-containing protein [Microbacterium halophytorum]
MSHTMTLRLPDELSDRLNRLAEATSRPKSFYVRSLLEEHLAEFEYVAGLDAQVEAIRRGAIEARPIDELVDELGFDADELRAEARVAAAE